MGQQIAQQGAGIAGSAIGGVAGAATGSPTLGGVAGGASTMALGALGTAAAPIALALGAVAIEAIALVEAFKTLDSIIGKAADNLSEYDGRVAKEYAMREVEMVKQRLRERQSIGGVAAEYANQQTRIDVTWEQIKEELVRGFADPIMDIKEVVLEIAGFIRDTLGIINDIKKTTGIDIIRAWMATMTSGASEIARLLRDIRKNTDNKTEGFDTPMEWLDDLISGIEPAGGLDSWGHQGRKPTTPFRVGVNR
jgi:hypothetical protein